MGLAAVEDVRCATPDSSAYTAASSFGRIPPDTSGIRSRTSWAVASEIRVVG